MNQKGPLGPPQTLIEQVANWYGIDADEIRSRRRYRHLHRARTAVSYILKKRGWSTTAIGDLLDRDHSSILSALNRLKEDPQQMADVRNCMARLR